MVDVINNCLSEIKKDQETENKVISLSRKKFTVVSETVIAPYFDYEYYENYSDNNFSYMVGTVLPTDVVFLDAIQEAAKGNVSK